jgi:hypothetical protein
MSTEETVVATEVEIRLSLLLCVFTMGNTSLSATKSLSICITKTCYVNVLFCVRTRIYVNSIKATLPRRFFTSTKQAEAELLPACNRQRFVVIPCRDIDNPHWNITWFSSVCPTKAGLIGVTEIEQNCFLLSPFKFTVFFYSVTRSFIQVHGFFFTIPKF